MLPLQVAALRTARFRRAANDAVDRAMRRLHDGPEHEADEHEAVWLMRKLERAVASHKFHVRMKADPSNCRWCGLAQREALAELEEDDGAQTA